MELERESRTNAPNRESGAKYCTPALDAAENNILQLRINQAIK
jgi:hypothetical protein